MLGFKQHFAAPPSSLKVQASFQGAWGLDYQCSALCTDSFLSFSNVQPRISKTLVKAFLDPTKPLATHYGAQGGKGD